MGVTHRRRIPIQRLAQKQHQIQQQQQKMLKMEKLLGAFGEKIIELMKENAGGLNIVPDSLGKPIEPKPETLIKRKERIFELPFSPGIQQIGRGWDSRFNRLAKRLVTFSKYDSVPTVDNPE